MHDETHGGVHSCTSDFWEARNIDVHDRLRKQIFMQTFLMLLEKTSTKIFNSEIPETHYI